METLRRGVLWGSGTVARKNRKRRRGRLALPCLRTVCMTISLFILAGCGVQERFTVPGTPRPLSCDIFTEFRWKELRFGVDSPAVVASVVGSLWGVEQDQFRFSNFYDEDLSLEWSDNHSGRDIGYSAVFGVERQLERVDVLWSPPATLAQVIDCLDAPQLYSADYGSGHHEAIFYLDLWYPDKGYSVHQSFYTRATPLHPLEPALRIDGFRVTAPPRPEQMVSSIYAAGDNPLRAADELCQFRSWPGSVEAVEAWWSGDDPRCQ